MLAPGTLIDQRYTLVRRVDSGSMGEVWLARESDARDVAIKFILAGKQDHELVQRFLDEVHTVAQLRSPHVVGVYHWGTFDKLPYMVMELLKGSNLAHRLRAMGRVEDIKQAVDYAVQACEALSVAHALGIIHRDLKPGNLFLDEHTRQIKVLDFGVAKATQAVRTRMTKEGSYFGTLAYSPPEQLASASAVTARSDIWALGAVLYELLTGIAAFPQDYPAIVTAIQSGRPRPLSELRPELPEGLAACIDRCLEKDSAARFANAEELIRALAEFGGSESHAIAGRLPEGSGPISALSSRDSIPEFHSEEDLVTAVCRTRAAPDGTPRRVIFMLGAGFSMRTSKRTGIPGTAEIVALIEKHLSVEQRKQLSYVLEVSRNKYQDAFELLASTRTTDVANAVIRKAVLRAHDVASVLPVSALEQQKYCAECEAALDRWDMPEGIEHLGRIIARGLTRAEGVKTVERRFSELHLTTNFDPLLAVSVRKHGGACFPFTVDKDFPIPEPAADACLLVHLHGRWNRGDTLHNNLSVRREQVERSLGDHLGRSVLCVLGYGGWDDVFTQTIKQLARGPNTLDVLWSFYSNSPREIWAQQQELLTQLQRLGPRIQFYRGVDTNRFFQRLLTRLDEGISTSDTDRPLERGTLRPEKSWRDRFEPFGVALLVALIGAVVWWLVPTAPTQLAREPDVVKEPTLPPEPPEPASLITNCSSAPPNDHVVKIGGHSIPVQAFCPPSAYGDREPHDRALLARYPGLISATTAELQPAHPFYSVTLQRRSTYVAVNLDRSERAEVTLRLRGRACANVRSVSVFIGDGRRLQDSDLGPLGPGPPHADEHADDGVSCDLQLELPWEAWGKNVNFRLEPGGFYAKQTVFTRATLVTSVGRSAPKPSSAPKPKGDECLPPRYCPD